MAAHHDYTTLADRVKTFIGWPGVQNPQDMAAAGFFYTGIKDKVKCFFCDGGLDNWETSDDPYEQHALHFNRCAYVNLLQLHYNQNQKKMSPKSSI
ncbi:inhibitor of apoptosis protein 3 [Orgyia leucostigma nucleopolyhedrovirus]|uniref:Inhibitor of apoptosis protein 3 n=1 Tax=Orgyia leucostigma nucleopolyhedrovirus TaxID=490711 RepID=B0FDN4_9ABAC|nr:inhibitor of apoptosis protein 3 [Orgyia leucostigma nucleopolyhedrovirus]ABY65742.1 inhibitor of apoptosis protein 3 [Orgyia leucostigma nucleopolyhedrovirus]